MDDHYRVEPLFLEFTSNDYSSDRVKWNPDAECVEVCRPYDEVSRLTRCPTRLQWKVFWLILEHINAWKWNQVYAPEGALSCDNHFWSLVVAKDGRYVNTCGYEAYPGTSERGYEDGSPFDLLRTAFEILITMPGTPEQATPDATPTEPESFEFHLWSDATETMGVCLRWDRHEQGLQWKPVAFAETAWIQLTRPSRLNWKAFLILLQEAKVATWEAEYASETTAHTGWAFKASIKGSIIETSGGDTYPQSPDGIGYLPGSPFDILLTALDLLIGEEVLQMRPPGEMR
jgi:hypothetical protein